MDYHDQFSPVYENDVTNAMNPKELIDIAKSEDRGYNRIYRMVTRQNGELKQTKVEVYTTSGIGSNIRDAETGQYYATKVGSADEDLFFSVILATGECKSKNGSSTLFYRSPQHYMSHMKSHVDEVTIARWEEKYKGRLKEKESTITPSNSSIQVR